MSWEGGEGGRRPCKKSLGRWWWWWGDGHRSTLHPYHALYSSSCRGDQVRSADIHHSLPREGHRGTQATQAHTSTHKQCLSRTHKLSIMNGATVGGREGGSLCLRLYRAGAFSGAWEVSGGSRLDNCRPPHYRLCSSPVCVVSALRCRSDAWGFVFVSCP